MKTSVHLPSLKNILIYFCFVEILACCSKPGKKDSQNISEDKKDETSTASPTESPTPEKDTKTSVGLGLLGESVEALRPSCTQTLAAPYLFIPSSGQQIVVDGVESDWTTVPAAIKDPGQDHKNGSVDIDLSEVRTAYRDETHNDIALLLKFNTDLTIESRVILEFGELAKDTAGKWNYQQSRRYLLTSTGVYELSADWQWKLLAPEISTVVFNGKNAEWQIERRQLDSIFNRSAWSLRILANSTEVIEPNTDDFLYSDVSSTAFFHSIDPTRAKDINIERCQAGLARTKEMTFLQVSDPNIPAERYEWAFDYVRKTLDDLLNSLPSLSLPLSELTTLVLENIGDQDLIHETSVLRPHQFDLVKSSAPTSEFIDPVLFYREILRVTVRKFVSVSESPETERRLIHQVIEQNILRSVLGESYWLSAVRDAYQEFLSASDLSARMPALAVFFEELFGMREISDALEFFPRNFFKGLLSLGGSTKERLDKVKHGWLDETSFDSELSPDLLKDDDHDGIPYLVENRYGTDPMAPDSDGDGWSDLAEHLNETDPLRNLEHPNWLVADGLFGDWGELLPTHIHSHPHDHVNSTCPPSTVFLAMSGINAKGGVLVSGLLEGVNEPFAPVSYELELQSEQKTGRIFRRTSHQSRMAVFNVNATGAPSFFGWQMSLTPLGGRAMEWFIPRHLLNGIEGKISARLTSTLQATNSMTCDSTEWFVLVSSE